jgi:hypothetical protein
MLSFIHDRSVKPTGLASGGWSISVPVSAWIILSLLLMISDTQGGEPLQNPHGHPDLCNACHLSSTRGKGDLRGEGHISTLCRSCHNGRSATRALHPSEIKPSAAISRKINSEFPLQDGLLTCLSCHDVASRCTPAASTRAPNPAFLRGGIEEITPGYCSRCHATDSYQPFNPHNQLDAEQVRDVTCVWCHVGVPDRNAALAKDGAIKLRDNPFGICGNCHSMGSQHPVKGNHLGVVPAAEMLSFMAAAELRDRMKMPFDALLKMVVASGRMPRQMPLDERNQIACYTCHNPHEKDLLPARNARSIGAEPDKSSKHRLRIRQGDICSMCHNL